MSTHIGYKKCQDDRIVKLLIQGAPNTPRKHVVNAKYIWYTCEQAIVLSITSWDGKIFFDEAASNASLSDGTLMYRVGETIAFKIGESPISLSSQSTDTHYFLDRQAAVCFETIPEGYTGLYNIYFSNNNGVIKEFYECVNGKAHGLHKAYNHNGKLINKSQYVNGKRHGLCEKYEENGELYEKCQYVNGELHGLYERYHNNGKLHEKSDYVNGKRHGQCQTYRYNGQLLEKLNYENGKLVSHDQDDIPVHGTEPYRFNYKYGLYVTIITACIMTSIKK